MKRWMLGFAVAFAACGPSTPPPQAPPSANVAAPASATCEAAIGHAMDLMAQDKANPPPPDLIKQFHDLFVSHCQQDAWSPQMRDCMNGIKTLNEGDKCESLMTDAQKQSLEKDMNASAPGGPPPTAAAPASAPSSAPGATPPPANTSRSGTPKKSGDPCDGGN